MHYFHVTYHGSILQIDLLLSMARRRYPEFRPHFVILFLGGNDVLSWNGQTSLAFEMARVCAHTLAQTGALDVWIASLFARGSSRWNPDPVIFNSMAGLVNTHLSREIRALDSQHLHILRHRCAANTNDSRSQDCCFLYGRMVKSPVTYKTTTVPCSKSFDSAWHPSAQKKKTMTQ